MFCFYAPKLGVVHSCDPKEFVARSHPLTVDRIFRSRRHWRWDGSLAEWDRNRAKITPSAIVPGRLFLPGILRMNTECEAHRSDFPGSSARSLTTCFGPKPHECPSGEFLNQVNQL